jgi:peptide/nickel transport system substrate-binding protein
MLRLAACVLFLLCAGASSPIADASADSKSDLSTDFRLSYNDTIDYQANVFASFNGAPYFIFFEVYDLLLNYDIDTGEPSTTYSPTKRYTMSKDKTTITYYLRPGLRWSDGKPLTSADVVFSYDMAPYSNVNGDYTTNVASVKALSPTVVQLKMKKYDARILSAYVPIVPKHIWDKVPPDKITKFNPCCPMVGSGPFYVKSLNPDGTTVLLPNKYFYGPKGHIKRILMIKYQDEESQLRDIKLGQIDAINSGVSSWATVLAGNENVKMWASPSPGFNELAFNSCPPQGSPICSGPAPGVNVKVVQDPAIRHALQYAINRTEIDTVVWHDLSGPQPGDGIISPIYEPKGYFKDWSKDPKLGYNYDPEKARQVLAEGGWQCPPNGGTCTKNGTKAEFTLDVLSSSSEDQQTALRIKAWAAAVGIKINLSIKTEDAVNAEIYATTSSKKPEDKGKYEPSYDAFMWGWGGDIATPDYNFDVMKCTNWSADAQWCNEKFTRLANEALAEPNFKKRVALLHEAERIELEASPYIVYSFTPSLSVTRMDTWTGWRPEPGANGQPFGWSWAQLQLVQPGKKAGSNYAGTFWVIVFMIGATALVVGVGIARRRREEHQPFELPEQPQPPTGEPALQ